MLLQILFLTILMDIFKTCLAINDPYFELPHRGCYFTNWSQYRKGKAKFTAADIDPSLCTYIAVAFAKVENDTLLPLEWNDEETFKQLIDLKLVVPTIKILLSVGGWTLSNQLVTVSNNAESRRRFATSCVTNLRQWELDGLDVDWEYPDARLKSQYSALLLDLREAFEVESRQSKQTRLALAAAVHFTTDGGYDGKILNRVLDIVNVMTYDLHGAWITDKTGHHAPLFKGPFGVESVLSTAATMKSWEQIGITKSKLVLGLPMYGRGWILSSIKDHGLGGSAKGPIPTSNFTSEAGAWPYYEICENFKLDNASYVFDKEIQASYIFTKDYWIGFDDRLTIAAKTKWAKLNGYGGVYIWDLAQDDFQNTCGLGKNPLLNVIRDLLGTRSVSLFQSGPWHKAAHELPFPPITRQLTTITTSRREQLTTIPPVQNKFLQTTMHMDMHRRITFPVYSISSVKNGFLPKPSPGKLACDKSFCQRNGPGSSAVGKCETKYCDCDAGNNPYSRECIGGLVYDTISKYCNWQDSVEGCQN